MAGHTDRQTHTQSDRVKTIPRNPLRGEVIIRWVKFYYWCTLIAIIIIFHLQTFTNWWIIKCRSNKTIYIYIFIYIARYREQQFANVIFCTMLNMGNTMERKYSAKSLNERFNTQLQFFCSYVFIKFLHKITMALLITPFIDDFQWCVMWFMFTIGFDRTTLVLVPLTNIMSISSSLSVRLLTYRLQSCPDWHWSFVEF